jgi:enoyl-CoA hydratase/carnithine racemase
MMSRKSFGEIHYEVDDNVALITIDRPERTNSLTPDGLARLCTAMREADADRNIRVIILTGAGDKSFSSGIDILNLPDQSIGDRRILFRETLDINHILLYTEKVTIAAVNGMALGVGFEISLLCDFTIATESATFRAPEVMVGLYPTPLCCTLLVHMIGRKRANEVLLKAKPLQAQEAAALGLVNEVVPIDKLINRAKELAMEITSAAPLPVAMCKARLNSEMSRLLDEDMSRFVDVQTFLFSSEDRREGFDALKTKRKPVWTGQ